MGNVLDAFIPQKRSRSGKQFGFVRCASMVDARGALYRLNGFHWLGKRIQVSLAKFESSSKFWRRVRNVSNVEKRQIVADTKAVEFEMNCGKETW
ncbi:hypothetical protein Gotri_022306 [Gossypium trilobum]|uniref:RRM domain-containing protein n=1 Tax=Gossypium trilobum TaxID=34281 RepID=A0A7J9DG27_9ROSI|nr:hypothetical protein [Gossypium trilobum]